MGGWGLDFLYSKETKSDSDIDFILDKKNYSIISNIVINFADTISINTREKIKFIKNIISFDICFFFKIDNKYFLDLDENDPLVYPMPGNSFPYKQKASFSGITATTISWEAQYVAKQGYFHCSKKPLREKDKLDLSIIIENLTFSQIELPEFKS